MKILSVYSKLVKSTEQRKSPAANKKSQSRRLREPPSARFLQLRIRSIPQSWTQLTPSPRSVCGGLRICTSSPYALCHQLSNGADASIAAAPHMTTNAAKGPRKPRTPTDTARAESSLLKVVCRMRMVHVVAPKTAQNWVSKCAGVQNVSRPIELCHERSHKAPTTALVEAIKTE